MNKTVRTASVLEIYNEAIKEFVAERNALIVEKTKISAKKGGQLLRIISGIIAGLVGVILFVVGAASDLVFLLVFGMFFTVFGIFIYFMGDSGEKHAERIQEINLRTIEIANEIEDRKTKKKALLEAEEEKIKLENQASGLEPQSVAIEESLSAEKVCPMCAETVKAAAKICRYCRHEFEGNTP
ncbi:MAG: hypothetical protein HOB84_01775 [Candidatus Marinimicrobia bacterium]|jgi:hypothetical protein|nr:hypothetical protein [Candidatus Neomarinimicrobiota bacterium]MBT4682691.1 hypothetical protein [Chloroflexota bacterium]MBT4713482.1 hypothetical protein [Candidatus Neomarinimicrobiota bacterium]MBT4944908.1 hypothetical protein [Candidatus Neomarinimicrobiota bacterium]MBT5271507.1 hypothetical protein [Candidatus Neomarinimicrobiota bacterium]